MIEPQNNLLPIAPGATTAEIPHGDATFGEMLAQTLGMIPQLDPVAIAPICDDGGRGEQADSGDTENATDPSADRDGELLVGMVVVPRPFVVVRPGGDHPVVADPEGDPEPGVSSPSPKQMVPQPPVPGVYERFLIGPDVDSGEPSLPAAATDGAPLDGEIPVAPTVAGSDVVPVAEDSPPVVPEATDRSQPPVPEEAGPPLRELPVRPEPSDREVAAPITDEMPVDSVPPEGTPHRPEAPQPTRRIDPAGLERTPVEPRSERMIPEDPTANRPQAAVEPPQSPTARLDVTAPVAVDSSPERPVQVVAAEVAMTEAGPVPVRDTKVRFDPAASRVDGPMPAFSAENTSGSTPSVSNFAGPAVPTQHTALAERVLEAVELQANQPPPRTMIVDLPEFEGLRLVVSVRSGAEVHVVPSSTSTNHAGLQPFLNELESVLADRGFVMTGDGRRRGNNPAYEEEPDLPQRRRPTPTRPLDDDLRI